MEQEASRLQGLHSLANTEGGLALIQSQKIKVRGAFEKLIDEKIPFKDKETALSILMANLDLLKELTNVKDKIRLLEKSLDIYLD